jgi:hypothetical protein
MDGIECTAGGGVATGAEVVDEEECANEGAGVSLGCIGRWWLAL